jgi:D-cysteine desulfhydrase family pyridoxal phosphate-dependent enzyme
MDGDEERLSDRKAHMNLSSQPREVIANLPTPLQYAPRLTEALGGPRIYIKRDDLTGLALGGNKTRKLEYLVAHALRQGATHLITIGGAQSNHVRQTSAAARLAGLKAILILESKVPEPEVQGNLLLDVLLGAEYHVIESMSERDEVIEQISSDLKSRGDVPYVIPVGGSNGVGSLGYVSAMLELTYQLWCDSISPVAMYFGSGSGGTQAGIELGARLFGLQMDIRGVMVSPNREAKLVQINRVLDEACQLLEIANPVPPDEITLLEGYTGAGYGMPTPEGLEAIALLARTEGILLDTVYTAKAFSAMIAEIRERRYAATDSVIFLHTGGAPALFAKVPDLQPILSRTEGETKGVHSGT